VLSNKRSTYCMSYSRKKLSEILVIMVCIYFCVAITFLPVN
jgi:hypothetical protein